MNEPLEREVAVLNAALELNPVERAAYLDQVCAGDAALRRQVETLLQAHEQAEGFLDAPPAGLDLQHHANVPTEKPGDKIGRYKLLQQIGEGGCGVVYMAEQEEPVRRRVALKVIKLGMDTKQVIARFEAERQALALMDHPNIAKVLDAGATETGRPYFVMELVRGNKITAFCDESKTSTEERLKLFIQVCQAIQHAHQKGIIHRDIKPSNILVTINDDVPVPKVIDFGIAKATQGRLTDHTLFTAFEQFIGTPAYMSPEQAVLTSLDIDTRSDIYSLGVLLYELLTGRTPFDQNELLAGGIDEMRRTIREKEPLKPSTRLNTLAADALTATAQHRHIEAPKLIHVIRGDLDWIVMKCLEKDRSRRYETANGLASDISRYLKNEPILARPPSKLYEFQKTVRRHRLGFALTTVIGLLLLLGVVSLSLSNAQIRREQKQKEDALEAATRNEQEAQRQLFTSLKKQAEARRYSRQVGQRTESLAAIAAAAKIQKDDELRDIAIAAMAVSDLRPGPSWQLLRSNDVAVAFDANYQRYAAVDEAGTIMIRSIPDGIELQRFESGTPALPIIACRGLEFSPDGRLLAKLEPGYQWSVWRLTDAQLLFRTASEGCSSIAFSKDSKRLAIGTANRITVFATETGNELTQWHVPEMPHTMRYSPDDARLAVGPTVTDPKTKQTITRIYNAQSGELVAALPTHSTFNQSVSWHLSGRYLAASCNFNIQLWDVEAAVKVSKMQRHASLVTAVAFSPDGTLVISDSWDDMPRLWSPSPGQELVHCFSGNNFFRFSSDGRWAGAMWARTGEARLLEVIPSREYQTFLASRHDAEVSFQLGDISPRGDLLALSSSTVVSLRELASGKEIATIPLGYVGTVKFTPDGNSLITCGPTSGLQVWPITQLNPASKLRLGPPRKILLPFAPMHISLDREGKTAAFASERSDVSGLVDLTTGTLRTTRFHHPNLSYVALSPNRQWLATSGWHSPELRVWNTETGELVMHQRQQRCFPTFTPDGSELIVAIESGFSFYSTNSWRPIRQTIPAQSGFTSWPAFSRNGTMMALGTSPGTLKILETHTGRVLAKLEDPHGHVPLFMGFANGDTQLLAMSSSARAIHRWDLRAIRAHLKSMGLDWDWPEFAPGTGNAAVELQVLNTEGQ